MQREHAHMLLDTLLDALQKRTIPAEAKGHFQAARREVLLGMRAVIDEAISRTAEQRQPSSGPTRIPVDQE